MINLKNLTRYFILLIVLNACNQKKETSLKEVSVAADENSVSLTAEQVKTTGIIIGEPEFRSISSVLKVNGKVEVPPQNLVSVSVPLGGYLLSTNLLPGMAVKKGDVLATLQDIQYIQLQQDYLTAKIKLKQLSLESQRQKELNKSKAASDKMLQQVEADYDSQRILVKSLNEKLELIGIDSDNLNDSTISKNINLKSSINGFVSAVDVNIGKYVQPGEVMFELVNPEDIHLALRVFQKDVQKLFIGQKVMANTTNNPEVKYPAEIILISQNVSNDGTVEVHCHFHDKLHGLIPGIYLNGEIQINNDKMLAVPEDAVVRYENAQYVFEKSGENKFQMKKIDVDKMQDGWMTLLDSTLSGKQLVLKNAYALLMKLKNTTE